MEPKKRISQMQAGSRDPYVASEKSFMGAHDEIPTPGTLSHRYRFLRELGHGAQGHVYLAESLKDGTKVAIKQLNISSTKNWKEYELFQRESDILSSLAIDGIATFYESLECLEDDPPCAYIVQEYIPGRSLQALMNEGRRFDVHFVYDLALQVLDILDALHRHVPPIIHRDIKPSNLILVPKGTGQYKVFLIDFGAVANPQVQGGGSTVAGTYGFMAPEQMMGKPEPASDIYALAAVLVNLFSGVSPAEMPVKDFHLIFEPEVQSLHPKVVHLLRQMLEPKVVDRLADIAVIKTFFNQFKADQYDLSAPSAADGLDAFQLDEELKRVLAYGMSGNMEIWQRLPEQTPRKVPLCCEKDIQNFEQLELKDIVIKEKNDSIFLEILLFFIMPFVPFGIIGGGSGIVVGIVLLFSGFVYLNVLTVLMIYFGIAALCEGISVIATTSNHRDKRDKIEFMLKVMRSGLPGALGYTHRTEKDPCASLQKLIANGRKTVARITNIEYVPVDLKYVKSTNQLVKEIGFEFKDVNTNKVIKERKKTHRDGYYSDKTKSENAGENESNESDSIEIGGNLAQNNTNESCSEYETIPFMMLNYGVPTFKVSYCFNPPDDFREGDIIHSFYMHGDPTDMIAIGDPMPILYFIERFSGNAMVPPKADGTYANNPMLKNYIDERVYSVPFPFPLKDPIALTDIIDSSVG